MKDTIHDQLINARKSQILDAAAKVFAEKGFHQTTIRDIAREAEIADGTIYNYFENKTGLLLGIFERMKNSALQEEVPQVLEAADFPTFIRQCLVQPLVALEKDHFALFRIVIAEIMFNEDLRKRYQEQIMQPTIAVQAKYLEQQAATYGIVMTDSSLVVRAMETIVLGLMMTQILGEREESEPSEALTDYLTALLVNALKRA